MNKDVSLYLRKIRNAFIVMISLHTLYELNDIRSYIIRVKLTEWNNNSIINSLFDTLFAILGFMLVSNIKTIDGNQLFILTIFGFILYLLFLHNKKFG